jgi:hypothetical protein
MNAPDPFAAAAEQVEVVELLEGVAVEEGEGDLLHERQDRNGSLQGFGEAGDEQRSGRSVLRRHHPNPPGDPRIAVGHDRARMLGAIGDLRDAARAGGKMDLCRNRLTEHKVHAVPLQRRGEGLGGDDVASLAGIDGSGHCPRSRWFVGPAVTLTASELSD